MNHRNQGEINEMGDYEETIGDFDTPITSQTSMGIRAPPCDLPPYEINSSLINMIYNAKFFGLDLENPIEHLDNFERLCDTTKIQGIPGDYVKLSLFSFSLGDKASQWEKTVVSSSITTWDQCKRRFLGQFYSQKRTTKFRNSIANFEQGMEETLGEAWQRFNGYVRNCPHHGFTQGSLLRLFHRGVHQHFRFAMNTASNGNFASLTAAQGEKLVENLAKSYDGEENFCFVPKAKDKSIEELSAKIDEIAKAVLTPTKKARINECYFDRQEEMSFAQESYYGSYSQCSSPRTNLGEQSPRTPTPPTTPKTPNNLKAEETHLILEGLRVGNEEIKRNINERIDELEHRTYARHLELAEKHDHLANYVRGIEYQIAEQASKCEFRQGILPGKCEVNPKELCQAVTLRSGRQLPPRTQEVELKRKEPELEEIDDDQAPLDEEEQNEKEKEVKEEDVPKSQEEESKDKPPQRQKRNKDYIPPDTEVPIDKLNLPFPGRFKKQILEAKHKKIRDQMGGLTVTIPFMDWCLDNPIVNKVLKDIITKRKRIDTVMEVMTHECSAIIQNKPYKKRKDPGSFTLPCTLKHMTFGKCLVDLGASVSLMPLTVSKKLGYTDFKPTRI